MIPRLSTRTPRMRSMRENVGEPGLESLAAEFSLLAQRRSRAIHQIQILDQQRGAAAAGFTKLQKRIAWLMDRMEAFSPRREADIAAVPQPRHHSLTGPRKPVASAPASAPASTDAAAALAAIGREWIAARPSLPPRYGRRT